MGRLINGKWVIASVATCDSNGAYDRPDRSFRDFVSDDHPIFKPESNRYHLYISHACPWASRTMIYRKLKGLEQHITYSVVHPEMLDEGWFFDESYPNSTIDHLYDCKFLKDIYLKADPKISTTVTVPILWDKKTHTIVNNESSEIIRMFNSSFDGLTNNYLDFYPETQRDLIDSLNEKIYHNVNNGVYKTGFATTQDSYNRAVKELFSTLDELDNILENKKFLIGNQISEADLRLIPTLLRFDCVYFTHFKCNKKRIKDYKNLSRYTKELFSMPAISESTNFDHIKRHYYYSHESINPFRIIPIGPEDFF